MKLRFVAFVRALVLLALLVSSTGCAGLLPGRGGAAKRSSPSVTAPRLPSATVSVPTPEEEAVAVEEARAVAERAPYRLRPGDPVLINLRGLGQRDEKIEEIVDERGYVTLPFIDEVTAAGQTVSDLERIIQKTYIDRKIYRRINVSVMSAAQSYFVQGEVRQPQRFPLVTGTTVMQAIAAAGGYTDYADPKRVTLTRGRDVRVINMREIERDPLKDVSVESGDVIRVPRSIF